jgi:tetratricopeptide (TPR) repeat protein
MRLLRALGFVQLLAIAAASSAGDAWAQAEGHEAEADRLFRDARNLLDQGRYKEACRLFERSLELESSPGTLLNLGNCHEQSGDLARALVTFERAIADARLEPDAKKRQAWVEAGTRRADSLAARVAIVNLSPSPSAGTSVSMDGEVLSHVGETLRLNPGRHVLRASAPAKLPFERELSLAPGQILNIALPELKDEQSVAPPVEPAPLVPARDDNVASSTSRNGTSIGPWILMGSGAALVTAGVVTALLAKSKESELERGCGTTAVCQDPTLRSTQDSGEQLALATYLLWGAGGISAAAGLAWFVLERNRAQNSASELSASCTDTGCTLFARGSF